MEWAQGVTSFAVWIAYGIWLRGRTSQIRSWVTSLNRTTKALAGAGILLVSAVVLLGGLMALNVLSGPRPASGFDPVSWLTVTVLGVLFVHLQVLGASIMIAMAQEDVASAPPQASKKKGNAKKKSL